MNVSTITMPTDEARERYDEYRLALRDKEPTPEDRGVMLGYAALAKGRALLDLPAVLRAGGVDAQGMPKLAAARAHWRWCHLLVDRDGRGAFADSRDSLDGRVAWHRRFPFPAGTLAQPSVTFVWRRRALVPTIPPNLRPTKALHRYVVLFEAEWQPVPPTDPLLLRHVHGALYAVLAAWDLTPLERAVLAGRLTEGPA